MDNRILSCCFVAAFLGLCFVCGCAEQSRVASDVKKPTVWAIEDDPELPRVLLIGDSISVGYTQEVRRLLAGRANVHRPLISPTVVRNCGPTTRGLAELDQWLGEKKWDVIHFNWGLHDMKYIDETGKRVLPANGRIQVPIKEYEKNLDKLVRRLKETDARLIFAMTTPVPEGAHGRMKGDGIRYNEVAERVMARHGVVINDLYSFAFARLEEIQRPRNVHFTNEGSKVLAEEVAANVSAVLDDKDRMGKPGN